RRVFRTFFVGSRLSSRSPFGNSFAHCSPRTGANESEQCCGTEAECKYGTDAGNQQRSNRDAGRPAKSSSGKTPHVFGEFFAVPIGIILSTSQKNDRFLRNVLLMMPIGTAKNSPNTW